MFKRAAISTALIGSLALAPLAGCENLPGGKKEQGAVIGGLGGAAAGAAVAKGNRGLGALIGGLIGAGGGYLIGAQQDKIDGNKGEEAREANDRAVRNPAREDDVARATTADLNKDGFVTLDEVVAMQKAGLNDTQMIDRLQRTDQVFELTREQQNQLADRGVSERVIDAMVSMNRTADARGVSDRYEDRYNDRYNERSGDRDRSSDRSADLDR